MSRSPRVSGTCAIALALAIAGLAGCKAEGARRKAAGNLLFNQGNYREARDEYAAAVRAEPADASARVLLGNALVELGDYGPARVQYQEALRLDAASPEAHRGVMTVIAHTAIPGDPEAYAEFLRHAEAIISARPKDRNAIIMAGIVTSESANPDDPEIYARAQSQAERYLRRALAIDDRDPKLLFHLALVYARKGELEVALRVVDRLELVEPREGFHLYAAAIVYTIAGKPDEALEVVSRLLALGVATPDELTRPTGYLEPLYGDPRFVALVEAAR